MPRIIFKNHDQTEFLCRVKLLSGLSTDELSVLCGVSARTFRDWLRGKHTISDEVLSILTQQFNLEIPQNIKVVIEVMA